MFEMKSESNCATVNNYCVCTVTVSSCDFQGYEYSRSGNPTRDVTEKCIASLEAGKYCEFRYK